MKTDSVLEYNFKIGVIEELCKKGLVTNEEKEKALEILKTKEEKSKA